MELFRHCPQCGRRFHIVLVGKKLAHIDKETVQKPPRLLPGAQAWRGAYPRAYPLALVEEGGPVTLDIEQFQYSYKCKHCGHEWYERHTEKHVEKPHES